jgi:hypothetical protein
MHGKHAGKVTDGPCLVRMPDGSLVMLWSSFGKDRRYKVGVARSASGDLLGPWAQDAEPLIKDDGGHPMVFETFGGQKMLTFHRPNRHPHERAQFVPITLDGDKVVLGEALPSRWRASPPLFLPGDEGAFDEVAVKDPSVVHHEGAWHVFYTARSDQGYSLGYVSAPTLDGLQDTERHPLPQLAGKREGYAAAPQVFFFAPQQKWYLVYQTHESNYQPVFSTTETIADPKSWSPPQPLMEKDERAKWIDYWVIGDETRLWCFFTRNHTDVYGAHTSLEDFPSGWSAPERMFGPVHEAVHVYKVSGMAVWHMIYELREEDGRRSFGLATANRLGGPWEKVTDTFATGDMLQFPEGVTPWTEEVSHGEALRTGMDHRLEYDAEHPRLLIQGLRMEEHQGTYTNLPWRLGVVEGRPR